MHTEIQELLECLTSASASQSEQEHCGLLLSMVVEKHSKQRSPNHIYAELMHGTLLDLALTELEYLELVSKIGELLTLSTLPTNSQEALLFALGGTDERTLDVSIPTLV